jgi:transcriptional regulator with XRE-family HTH domain
VLESFGDALRNHRLAAGLTQEAIAERAGLSVHAIQKLEQGVSHPHRDTSHRLVQALRLSGEAEAQFRTLGQPARAEDATAGRRRPQNWSVRCARISL